MKNLKGTARLTFLAFFKLNERVKKERPDVPPTRDEILSLSKTQKLDLKELVRLGYLYSKTLLVKEKTKNGEQTNGRNCYYLTTQGLELAHHLGLESTP